MIVLSLLLDDDVVVSGDCGTTPRADSAAHPQYFRSSTPVVLVEPVLSLLDGRLPETSGRELWC